jgi:hypothetical protein
MGLPAILVNYNYTPNWLHDYDLDYLLYDRSDSKEYLKDFPQERIIYTANRGNVDYDKLTHLVTYYDTLPEVFLWGKTNLFKYITRDEFDAIKDYKGFAPLLTQHHRIYSDARGQVNYYRDSMYYERNDSWYLGQTPAKTIDSFGQWAHLFQLPNPDYIPFPPGGNFILTRDTVHKHGVNLYERMAEMLPYCQEPGEAQLAERSYYLLWR